MKFAFKLLQRPNFPWVKLFFQNYSYNISHKPTTPSFLWHIINQQIPTLLSDTFFMTNNGLPTFFWLDSWLLDKTLKSLYPHLFSHSKMKKVLASTVWNNGLLTNLRNRLIVVALLDLEVVLDLLQDFVASNCMDERCLPHGLPFSQRNAYNTIMVGQDTDTNHSCIWASRVPIKLKIFFLASPER